MRRQITVGMFERIFHGFWTWITECGAHITYPAQQRILGCVRVDYVKLHPSSSPLYPPLGESIPSLAKLLGSVDVGEHF